MQVTMRANTKLVRIDPNGDMLIILKDPDTALLKWKSEEDLLKEEEDPKTMADDEKTHGTEMGEEESTEDEAGQVQFLVSHRQMRIASPYFDNIFKRDYSETLKCAEDNLYHIQAQQWSPDAMEIILNIAHQQVRAIPTEMEPVLFAQVFIAADYYQMTYILEPHMKTWWTKLEESNVTKKDPANVYTESLDFHSI
ncbi:Nuclear pore [Pyrenophora seminiperda CCB06]|uniref:Nuclear pore n=1 Tax=Pyrenophora seminiperda CCB06 TaxID=1302712 RepID=A0A3M7LVN7_9PLEO|nr:Nuclear pore [Pyrenophora seminiperda CCB06]